MRLNFDRVGLVRSMHGPLTLYHARERQLPPAILKLADGIPMFNPSGAPARLTGRDIVPGVMSPPVTCVCRAGT